MALPLARLKHHRPEEHRFPRWLRTKLGRPMFVCILDWEVSAYDVDTRRRPRSADSLTLVCFIVMFLLFKHVRLTCVLNKLMMMMMVVVPSTRRSTLGDPSIHVYLHKVKYMITA